MGRREQRQQEALQRRTRLSKGKVATHISTTATTQCDRSVYQCNSNTSVMHACGCIRSRRRPRRRRTSSAISRRRRTSGGSSSDRRIRTILVATAVVGVVWDSGAIQV